MASAAAELFVKVSASLDGLLGGFRKAGEAADGMSAKVSETQEALRKLAEEDEGIKRARTAAAALGKEFDLVAEAVKQTEQAVIALSKKGLGPGNAEFDKAIKNLKIARDAHEALAASSQQTTNATSNLKDVIGGVAIGTLLADGIRSAASAMVNMGTQSIKLAGELEQNKVAFTTMLKSAEAADKMLKDLAAFAANTPFELRGLTDSAKKLLAFGFQSESIIPIMTALGDAIGGVGGGQEAIGQVTMALGQMAAKGKVSAEEMNQFAEKGINTWKYVADAIGKSVPEAMKLAEKGAIDAATAIPAILEGMSKEFGGMMQKQSQTWNGALSNFQDSTDQAMTKIGTAIINMGIGDLLRTMTIGINNVAAAFESGAIIPILDGIKAAAIGTAAAFTAYLVPSAIASGGSIAAAFSTAALAAAPFIALAAAVAFAAYPIIKNWQEIKWALEDVFNAGSQVITDFYNRGARIAADLANNFTKAFTWIGSNIRRILGDELTNKLIGGMKAGGEAALSFAEKVSPALFVIRRLPEATANFKETWGDAMTSARNLTTGLFTETKTISPEIKKITAELLGLKKAGATADQLAAAQKKLEAAQRAAEVAARKHAAEMERQTRINEQAYTKFESMAMALEAVSGAMRAAEADAQRIGRGFDLAGAKAEAIKKGLSAVESAFGKFSPQATNLRNQMFYLGQESANGGAAFAQAAKVIDDATKDLDMAREVARVLGKEFNELEVALGIAENAMKKLIEKGLKPGDAAYDEQIAKLKKLQEEQKKVPLTFNETVKAMTDGVGAFTSIGESVGKLATLFGLEIPDSMAGAARSFKAAGEAIIVTTGAITALNVAWGLLNGTITISPIGWIAIGIGALVGAIAFVVDQMKQWNEAQKKANEDMLNSADAAVAVQYAAASSNAELRISQAEFAATAESAKTSFDTIKKAAGDGLKTAILAFTAGADNYGEILRTKLREGIFHAIVDSIVSKQMAAQFDSLIGQIVDSFTSGIDTGREKLLKDLEEKVIKTSEAGAKILETTAKAFGMLPGEIKRMSEEAMGQAKALRDGMASRNREAQASYLGNLQRSVQSLREKGYHLAPPGSEEFNRYTRAIEEANRAAANLRGMATGGLVTGPTFARLGEGGRDEAVLPLNDRVYSSIAEGIAGAGASGAQVVINYTGNGKWTREDAQGLGRLLVAELRSMGVRA